MWGGQRKISDAFQGSSWQLFRMLMSLPRLSAEEAESEVATILRAGEQLRAHPEKHACYLKKLGIYNNAKVKRVSMRTAVKAKSK